MNKNDGVIRRYSEGFKLGILSELSTGNYNKRDLGRIAGKKNKAFLDSFTIAIEIESEILSFNRYKSDVIYNLKGKRVERPIDF